MSKNVGLISLGCPKNLVDSEIMLGLLEKAGYRLVTDPHSADIIIINTCGFIEDSKRESIETILEMAKIVKGPKSIVRSQKKLVVTGCLAQRYKDEVLELFPEVDLFIGTGDYPRIVELLEKDHGKKHHIGLPEYIHTANVPRRIATAEHAVYVKIAEGCFHGCSFCAIPKMRGKFRSRAESDIVKEVKTLLKNGAKEINLIAQDTTSYGRDLKNGANIVTLLEKLVQISGEKWYRLMYTYPQSFKKEIVGLMKEFGDICKYIDIPIQHIDDDILESMRRGRSEKSVRKLIEYIKTELPEVTLRTSIITGFPGEKEKQHKKLLKFISEGWFDHVGVFKYSEEEGTAAAKLKGHVADKTKEARRKELMSIQKKISRKKMFAYKGARIKVLVDGLINEKKGLYQARSEFQAPDIDGITYVTGKLDIGKFYWVEIIGSSDYDLNAKVVEC